MPGPDIVLSAVEDGCSIAKGSNGSTPPGVVMAAEGTAAAFIALTTLSGMPGYPVIGYPDTVASTDDVGGPGVGGGSILVGIE